MFKEEKTYLYLMFVRSVIPIFDNYKTFLQSPQRLVRVLHHSTQRLQKTLLLRFGKAEVLSVAESDLDCIDINLEVNLKPLFNVFIGMMARQYAIDNNFIGTSLNTKFLKKARKLFQRCVSYLPKSIPVLNGVIKSLTFLRVPDRHKVTMNEMSILLKRFPKVL